jgi:hypothetical protein
MLASQLDLLVGTGCNVGRISQVAVVGKDDKTAKRRRVEGEQR